MGIDVIWRGQVSVCLLAVCVLWGCQERRILRPAELDPDSVGRQALLQYDTNGDAKIDAAELQSSPGLLDGMWASDQDEDKALTAEEIAARVRFHADRKVALLPVRYAITLDGKPLQGATMTLVPEEFFQEVRYLYLTGDAEGIVEPTMEFEDKYKHQASLRGVRPGVYRIQISKTDANGREMIPAKYNTESKLGREVGVGPHQHGPVISTPRDLRLSSR